MAYDRDMIKKIYTAFNARDIDTVFLTLDPAVTWSNGWEGGYVQGHDAVRSYWTRQWKEVDPHVEPVGFREKEDGRVQVEVHQVAKDMEGNILFDGLVQHIYTFENGLITRMDIEKP